MQDRGRGAGGAAVNTLGKLLTPPMAIGWRGYKQVHGAADQRTY